MQGSKCEILELYRPKNRIKVRHASYHSQKQISRSNDNVGKISWLCRFVTEKYGTTLLFRKRNWFQRLRSVTLYPEMPQSGKSFQKVIAFYSRTRFEDFTIYFFLYFLPNFIFTNSLIRLLDVSETNYF